jgi:succinate-acetate transporter protein
MIQRIQSIYFFLAAVALLALFAFPLVHGVNIDGVIKNIKIDGVYEIVNGQPVRTVSFLMLTIATILLALVPIISIFMFKNRKLQLALGYGGILAIIGFSFWMSQIVQQYVNGATLRTDNYGIGMLLSSISIVFLLLAIKSVKKDEKLIKSADRLR